MNPATAPRKVERRQAPARPVHRDRRGAARGAGAARGPAEAGPTRALIVCGSDERSVDLARLATRVLEGGGVECELLDPAQPAAEAVLRERCAAVHGLFLLTSGAAEPWLERLADADPAGRAYGLVVQGGGDPGAERLRRDLADRLDDMGLIDADAQAQLDRFIGYYTPYAPDAGDVECDEPQQEEVRGMARAMTHVMGEIRAGRLTAPDLLLARRRPPGPPAGAGLRGVRSPA